jgi:hypothetical protein
MTKQTLFEQIKWGCKTHPCDIAPRDYIDDENYVDVDSGERLESLKTYVIDKGSNWEWFCEIYNYNHLDENGKW